MLVLNGRAKSVDRLAFSPAASLLAAAGDHLQPLDVWAIDFPHQLRHRFAVDLYKWVWNFCFTPDRLLITTDGTEVVAFDSTTSDELWRVEPRRNSPVAGLSV